MNVLRIRFLPMQHFVIATLVVGVGASVAGGCNRDEKKPSPVSSMTKPEITPPTEVSSSGPTVVPVDGPVVNDFSGQVHDQPCEIEHVEVALGLVEGKLLGEAVTELERGVFDDPSDFATRQALGELYRERGELELAVGHLRAALEEIDDSAVAMSLAQTYFDLGDFEMSKRTITTAVKLDPTSPEPFRLLSRVYQSTHMWKESIDALEEAIARGSDSPWTYNNLGYAHLMLGHKEDAVRELEKAVSYDTGVTPQIWNNLGLAYEKSSLIVDAASAYRAALAGNPTYVKAKVNLDRVVTIAKNEGVPIGERTAEVLPGVPVE